VEEAISLMEEDKSFKDLEDTLQYVLAKREKCQLICAPDIEVINTQEFCEKYLTP